jgi:PLP dependent protein
MSDGLRTAAVLRGNLERIREEIAAAAIRSGRPPDAVRLVAVTKYVSSEVARLLVELGVRDLGESRPQALWAKVEALGRRPPEWHLIGRLQRNKLARTLPLVDWLHSVDSERLLGAIDAELAARGSASPRLLLEINIARDANKQGAAAEDAPRLVELAASLPRLRIAGLMAMPRSANWPSACEPRRRKMCLCKSCRWA